MLTLFKTNWSQLKITPYQLHLALSNYFYNIVLVNIDTINLNTYTKTHKTNPIEGTTNKKLKLVKYK